MYYTANEHEQLHYAAWERGLFAKMDYAGCAVASAVAGFLLTGIIPANHPFTAALTMATFAGWIGWCAHRLHNEHTAFRSELSEIGCGPDCWSIQDGLRTSAQQEAR
ncbi:hypothetical protein [Nocardia salmonicida]|uniref:hypothetical protein n=1 Tax=Nocardia salmonicida TaxID=53431 RepID=UPI0007A3F1C5|nr:hypothetical protein [Nocardia salmonicida]